MKRRTWRWTALAVCLPFVVAPSLARSSGGGSDPAGIDQAVRAACDREVVFLGEDASHGAGRTLEIKARIVARLVTECGFGAVLFESQFYDFLDYERGLKAGKPDRKQLADAIGALWSGTREMQPLIDQLHALASEKKVRLGGIDPQVGGITGHFSQRSLGSRLASGLSAEAAAAGCVAVLDRHHVWAYDTDHPFDDAEKGRLRQCVKDIVIAMGERDQNAVSSESRAIVSSYARYAAMALDGDANARDRGMFENLLWYRLQYPPRLKIVVWTATVHAAKASWPGSPFRPLGSYVHEAFPGKVFTLGFTARTGAVGRPGGRGAATRLAASEPQSLESVLLPTGDLSFADGKAMKTLGRVIGRALNYSKPQTLDWSHVLDGLIVVREETIATPAPEGSSR